MDIVRDVRGQLEVPFVPVEVRFHGEVGGAVPLKQDPRRGDVIGAFLEYDRGIPRRFQREPVQLGGTPDGSAREGEDRLRFAAAFALRRFRGEIDVARGQGGSRWKIRMHGC